MEKAIDVQQKVHFNVSGHKAFIHTVQYMLHVLREIKHLSQHSVKWNRK